MFILNFNLLIFRIITTAWVFPCALLAVTKSQSAWKLITDINMLEFVRFQCLDHGRFVWTKLRPNKLQIQGKNLNWLSKIFFSGKILLIISYFIFLLRRLVMFLVLHILFKIKSNIIVWISAKNTPGNLVFHSVQATKRQMVVYSPLLLADSIQFNFIHHQYINLY
jgi:hypothetical protein